LSVDAPADMVSKSGGTSSAPGRLTRRPLARAANMQSVRPHPTTSVRFRSVRLVPGVCQVFGLAVVALALVACASSESGGGKSRSKGAAGGDVSYTSLSSNAKLRLVSDQWIESQGYEGLNSDERRADFYSKNVYTGSSSAAVKVCDDAIFDGVVEALVASGFPQYATQGTAAAGGRGATQYIELTVDGQVRHFALTAGMPAEAVKTFQACRSIVGDVFNAVDGYQSGGDSFQFSAKPARAGS